MEISVRKSPFHLQCQPCRDNCFRSAPRRARLDAGDNKGDVKWPRTFLRKTLPHSDGGWAAFKAPGVNRKQRLYDGEHEEKEPFALKRCTGVSFIIQRHHSDMREREGGRERRTHLSALRQRCLCVASPSQEVRRFVCFFFF